ncbi:hypothetical protein OBBRIDRAFT_802140 [Obba rivulosa]|uniref:CAP-Gly domain-containing protein n=1 Tax=Obba rivulosa TaxID=1052685 RepID=A0A8E2B6A4_9APHY|nr:hypothetical protein OBBRIDRAFT_802140 [Obba rivulosa]
MSDWEEARPCKGGEGALQRGQGQLERQFEGGGGGGALDGCRWCRTRYDGKRWGASEEPRELEGNARHGGGGAGRTGSPSRRRTRRRVAGGTGARRRWQDPGQRRSRSSRKTRLPTPAKATGIPTPTARARAGSAAGHYPPAQDDEFISRAFADAIKSNDPAQHRSSRASEISLPSLSPSTSGRPSSAASSSSAVSSAASKPKATLSQVTIRPQSRQSDISARSASRTGRAFEVGDFVRIASQGFEGTLRYIGRIEGKPGVWAGVELLAGFAGKGKNDGSVDGSLRSVYHGIKAFACDGWRQSPTPFGCFLPQRKSHTVNLRQNNSLYFHSSCHGSQDTVDSSSAQATITPGSRASRYAGMTAKQLRAKGAEYESQRPAGTGSPTRPTGLTSPVSASYMSSPTRGTSSPYATPRATMRGPSAAVRGGLATPSKSRYPTITPRARIPSSVAMPPPTSPASARHDYSISLDEPLLNVGALTSSSDLELNGKLLQEKIAGLMSGKTVPTSRPSSAASTTSSNMAELQGHIDKLQARLDSLQDDNARLQQAATQAESEVSSRMDKLLDEQKQSASRITDLEVSLRIAERALSERDGTIESLQRSVQQSMLDIEKTKGDGEARARDLQSQLDDKDALIAQLKQLIEAKEGLQSENDAVLRAKDAEISVLQARVQKAYVELEEERRELGGQVDELRKAGQETIALYEERLSAADAQRYELEDLVASLQEQLRTQVRPPSPTTLAQHAASAAEIDNEALREQVQHLQKKISTMEDMIEDTHFRAEQEEAAMNERLEQLRETEDGLRRELEESRSEIQRVMQSEEAARQRLQESDEALKENLAALENARAEIEFYRSEIEVQGFTVGSPNSFSSEKLAEFIQKTPSDRTRLLDEIAQLQQQLKDVRMRSDETVREASGLEEESTAQKQAEDLAALQSETAMLQHKYEEKEAQLVIERKVVQDLRQQLEERNAELDTTRKKLNRDFAVNGIESTKPVVPSSPSKHDLAAARDEITGLKHIVQELQKENSIALQHNKMLESENRLLLSETEQLREDLRALEENVEQSILREEEALSSGDETFVSGDLATLQKTLKEMKVKFEIYREVRDLSLSSLDELEREVERLREKLSRSQKKSSRADEDPSRTKKSSSGLVPASSPAAGSAPAGEGDAPAPRLSLSSVPGINREELYCEDCEGRGHTAANCPHSLDVF